MVEWVRSASPPGRYGTFTANGGTGLILGVVDSAEPTVYEFQSINLNGLATIELQGPVVMRVAYGFSANGTIGSIEHPGWLDLSVSSGGLTLNGGAGVSGYVSAPAGTVVVGGNAILTGGVVADRIIVNGSGVLRLMDRESGNLAPSAFASSIATAMNVPVAVELAGHDPESAALIFFIVNQPARGAVSLAGNIATYSPDADFAGSDSFQFAVSDGELQSTPATVAVVVTKPLLPPVGKQDEYLVTEGSYLSVSAAGVLVNDLNPSELALSAELLSDPALGTLNLLVDGGFNYQPNPGAWGVDRFWYRPVGEGLRGDSTEVTIRINARPVVSDLEVTTLQNRSVLLSLIASDPEGEPVTASIVASPVHGTLLGDASTGLTYQPNYGFQGDDVFSIIATDPLGASGVGICRIHVVATGSPPVARIDAISTDSSAPFHVTFSGAGSTDADGTISRYQWDLNGDGVFDVEGDSPTRIYDQGGQIRVTLSVTDNQGFIGTDVRVMHLNLPPTVEIKSPPSVASFLRGATVPVDVVSRDLDGFVASVEVYVDGESRGSLAPGEGRLDLHALTLGTHRIVARATDNSGAVAESSPLVVTMRPTLADAGNFVVHPDLRVASLAAVPGLAEGGAGQENQTTLPVFADNFYSATVEYVVRPEGDSAGGFSGYLVRDSATSTDVTYSWEDISLTGRKLDITNVDDGFETVPLSFDFWLYDRRFSSVIVGTNGVLTFEQGSRRRYPQEIPSPTAPGYMLGPFWTDLLPGYQAADGGGYGGGWSEPSAIYVQDFGDRMIIQYSADAQFFGQAPDPENGIGLGVSSYNLDGTYTFQVVLYRSGDVDFVYRVMNGVTWAATVGIQDGQGEDGIQLAYYSEFVSNHRTIRFTGTPVAEKWFTVDRQNGSLSPGASDEWSITFHSKPDFPPGVYRGQVRVDHTQPGLDPYLIDIALEVFRRDPDVEFISPRPGSRRYFVIGDTVPVQLVASDDDGLIRKVVLSSDGQVLTEWASAPFSLAWNPGGGLHTLSAVAIDNDGRMGISDPLEVSVSADSDGDGLPDAWEIDYLGSLQEDGEWDSDYDGRSNKREYFLGSSPAVRDLEPVDNEPPVAQIEYAKLSSEPPFRVGFDARSSYDRDGQLWFFQWDFDDDGEWDAFDPYVEHVFSAEGPHRVRLMVGDSDSAFAETYVDVRLRAASSNLPPKAEFSASAYAVPAARTIAFDSTGSTDDTAIAAYEWSFGDGGVGRGPKVEHYFADVGIFPVQLTIRDSEGESATTTKYITVTHRSQSAFQERDGFVVLEAEHATTLDPRQDVYGWQLDRPSFGAESWGLALLRNDQGYLPGTDVVDEPVDWDRAARAGWRVAISTPGIYYAAIRYATGTLDESGTMALRLGVDGSEVSPPTGDPLGHSFQPVWQRTVSLGYLSVGVHDIDMGRQQDLVWVDQLVFAADKDRLPQDGSSADALPAAWRPGLEPRPPIARIAALPQSVTLPVDLHLDASESEIDRGLTIVAQNWRLDRTLDVRDGSIHQIPFVVGVSPVEDVEIEGFGAAIGSSVADDRLGVELTVVDNLGRLSTTRSHINLVDPLEALTDGVGLVVDDESPQFMADETWRVAAGDGLFIDGEYFRGGMAEYLDQLGGLLSNPPATVKAWRVGLTEFVGSQARLNFNYSRSIGGGATFIPDVQSSGRYLVFARWPRHNQSGADGVIDGSASRFGVLHPPVTRRAVVSVRGTSGESTILLNQRDHGGHWVFLGTQDFAAGSGASVVFSPAAAGEMVLLDAVKLVPAGAGGAAPTAAMDVSVEPGRRVRCDGRASTDSDGNVVAWFWEFGDGHTSRGRHPNHTYAEPGVYAIRLTVVDDALNISTTVRQIEIPDAGQAELPVARYLVNAVRGRVPFVFTADASPSSSDGPMSAFLWETTLKDAPWNNENRFVAEGSAASFVFNRPGTHLVRLRVVDRFGRTDEVSLSVEAIADGMSTLRPFVVDDRSPSVQWTGSWYPSIGGRGLIDTDGDPGIMEFAARDLTGAGYFVANTVDSSAAFRASLPTSGLYQVSLRYPAGTHDAPLRVRVDHADGPSRVDLNNSVGPGDWQLLGTFLFVQGQEAAVSFAKERPAQDVFADAVRWVPVGGGTRSAFEVGVPVDVRAPARFSFDGTLSSADTAIVSYSWNFGDGSVGIGSSADHVYSAAGSFVVTLTITDDRGASAASSRLVRVDPTPTPPVVAPSVTPQSGTAGLVVQFDASASSDPDGIRGYVWDFGDGTSSAAASGRHRFDRPGVYEVSLRVVDSLGTAGAASVLVNVLPDPAGGGRPRLDFDLESGSVFSVSGVDPEAVVAWNFGDGTSATGLSASHAYAAPGAYLVTATISTTRGSEILQRWIVAGTPTVPADVPRNDSAAELILYTPLAPRP